MADGSAYEQLAQSFLEQHGLTSITQNFRSRQGEIDLIMEHEGVLVFVEVRFRRSTKYGSAEDTITYFKRRHIVNCAKYYLTSTKSWHKACRFDVVSIHPGQGGSPSLRFNWIKSAFDAYE